MDEVKEQENTVTEAKTLESLASILKDKFADEKEKRIHRECTLKKAVRKHEDAILDILKYSRSFCPNNEVLKLLNEQEGISISEKEFSNFMEDWRIFMEEKEARILSATGPRTQFATFVLLGFLLIGPPIIGFSVYHVNFLVPLVSGLIFAFIAWKGIPLWMEKMKCRMEQNLDKSFWGN